MILIWGMSGNRISWVRCAYVTVCIQRKEFMIFNPDSLDMRDPEFIRAVMPFASAFNKQYLSLRCEGNRTLLPIMSPKADIRYGNGRKGKEDFTEKESWNMKK